MGIEILTEEKQKKPPAIILYAERIQMLRMLNDKQLSNVIKAVFEFYSEGVIPELKKTEMICFSQIQLDIMRNFDKYEKTCKRNKENRNKYKNNEPNESIVNKITISKKRGKR